MKRKTAGMMATASKEGYIHYQGLSRRQLQRLSKKHGIPANRTSAFLAEALSKLLQNGIPSPPGISGPGMYRCTTPHHPPVLQPASSFATACKSETCVVESHICQNIAQKFRVKNEYRESGGRASRKEEPATQSGGAMAGPNFRKETEACDLSKVKQEQGVEVRPPNAEGWKVLGDTLDDFDDPFARLEAFTPSMEAFFSLDDDGVEVNQASPVHQDTESQDAKRMEAVEVVEHGSAKKPCSPGEVETLEASLKKVVILKEKTSEAEVAVGKQSESGCETVELRGPAQETCTLENAARSEDAETTDRIATAQGSDLHKIWEKNPCRTAFEWDTLGKKSQSDMDVVDPYGTTPGSNFPPRGIKRSFWVSGETSRVSFEPPKAMGSPMAPATQSLNFEYFVERPGGISLTVDLNAKCSPGTELLQYFHRLEAMTSTPPGFKKPAPMQSPVRVTRISSILNLAAEGASPFIGDQ